MAELFAEVIAIKLNSAIITLNIISAERGVALCI